MIPAMDLASDDLARLFVPTPPGFGLEDLVESVGGVPIGADGNGEDFDLVDADEIGSRGVQVLRARQHSGATLRDLARAPSVLAVLFEELDEGRLLELRDLEDELTLLVPGRVFASGWRAGAAGTVAPVLLAAPDAFVAWCGSFEEDLSHALTCERRMQKVLESSFEPLARRAGWDADERLLALSCAWRPISNAFEAAQQADLTTFGRQLAAALEPEA